MNGKAADSPTAGSNHPVRRLLACSRNLRWSLALLLGCLVLLSAPRLPAATVSYAAAPTTFSWINTTTQTLIVTGPTGGAWSGGAACTSGYDGATPDDDITWQVPLGFTFTFASTPYTQVQIDANGRLQFNNGACGFGGPFIQIPTTAGNTINTPTTTIIPYSLDFDPGNPTNFPGENTTCAPPGCGVFYGTGTTSGGMQYFVVTWYNVPESGQGPCPGCLVFSVQAILYANGTFEFQYQNNSSDPPTDSNGNLPAIGWVVNTTGNYYNYPYIANINNTNNITALNNTAILFGPNLLDHFAITASAYGSTCSTSSVPVTITAEDVLNNVIPNYTGLVTITVSSGSGNATLSVNKANGTLTFLGFDPNTGYPQWSYQFVAADAGGIILNMSDTSGETVNVTVTDFGTGISNTSTNTTFRGGTLVVANAPSEIPVPVAGRPQNMTVTKYNGCNIATGFNPNNQKMTVWLTLDPSQPAGAGLPGVTGNDGNPKIVAPLPTAKPGSFNIRLKFTRGVADFTLNTTDVGKYLLNWCQGNGNTCGSAPITVIPYDLLVNVSGNAGAQSLADPKFMPAGRNFTATVTAYAWSSADACNPPGCSPPTGSGISVDTSPGLALSHFSSPVTITAATPFLPSAGTQGVIANGTLTVTNGSGTANSLQYSEVGSVTLQATAQNYLNTPGVNATGYSYYTGAPANSSYVGRFYPDHFFVSYVDGCNVVNPNNFTYSGQPFKTFTVTAMNAYGSLPADVTHNYDGKLGFAQNVTLSDASSPPAAGSFTPNPIPAASFTSGAFMSTGVTFTFTTQETAPATLTLRATDPDGTSSAGTAEPLAPIQSGRVHLLGAVGSELLDLPLPLYLEAFQGADSGWQVNANDTCTTLATSDFSLSYLPGGLPGGTTSIKGVSLTNGQGSVTLASPGAGNTGDVDVAGSGIPAWLQFDWQTSGTLADPTARASFGVYQGDSHQIYIQVIH